MLRLLIGSSNVYRNYSHGDFEEYQKYKMVKCTNREVFATALDSIDEGKGKVIISVVENLLCDAVKDITEPEAMNSALEAAIKGYLAMVKEIAIKKPGVSFALAQPTLRPAHHWFTEGYDAFGVKIGEGIRLMNCHNVSKIEGPIKMSQIFETDGVHLTETSGKVFVNALLYHAEALFTAEVIDLENEKMEEDGESDGETDKNPNRDSLVKTEIADLKDDIGRRRVDDCMVTARIREELDFISNVRKEDRIILTGLTSLTPAPVAFEERKKWMKDLVGGVLNKVEEGASGRILNVIQGWKGDHNIPLAEVRMDGVELAGRIRKLFAEKKAGTDFGRVYMANSVTLGTRVRIEILKAVAKKCAGEGESMYVSAFTSRPLLHVKSRNEGHRPMAFCFADAITRYGENLERGDLGNAYRRAGTAFSGQLQQNFVVLHDVGQPGPQRAQGIQRGTGSGRGRQAGSGRGGPRGTGRGGQSGSGRGGPSGSGRGGPSGRENLKRRIGNGEGRCATPEKKKK